MKAGDVVRVIDEKEFHSIYGLEPLSGLYKIYYIAGSESDRYCLVHEFLGNTFYAYRTQLKPFLEVVTPEEAEAAFPTPKAGDLVWNSDCNYLGVFKGADSSVAQYYRLDSYGGVSSVRSDNLPYFSVVKGKTVEDFRAFPEFMRGCAAFTYKNREDRICLVIGWNSYRLTYITPEGYVESFNLGSGWNFMMLQEVDASKVFEDPAIKAWGLTVDNLKDVFEGFDGFHDDRFHDDRMQQFFKDNGLLDEKYPVSMRLNLFRPKPSAKVAGNLAIYNNKSQLDKGIPVSMKAGRAFRAMFPHLNDKELEKLVDQFRIEFPILSFKVQESTEAWAFKHAYSHTMSPYENIYTTSQRKSLANSCMRHDFSRMKTHPCEVYASGDFKIIWTEDEQGRIGSRCVVYLNEDGDKPQAGPVYGTSENSIDIIVEELEKFGANYDCNASWRNARLNYVNDGHGVVGPYLDIEQSLYRDGDYLVIGGGREYEACSYSGYIQGGRGCDECGDFMDEDDSFLDDEGGCYCESCFHDIYTRCDHSGDLVRQDEIVSVYAIRRSWGQSRPTVLRVHNSFTEDGTFLYCEDRDEFWEEGQTVCDHNGITQHIDDVTLCEETDEYYSPDLLAECADGKYRNLDFLKDNGWVLDSNGLYDLPQEEEESEAA